MPPYPEPDWLQTHLGVINGSGYQVNIGENAGSTWAQETDEVGTEFFGLVLEDVDQAITQIPDYLTRFREINDRNLSLLNPILPVQFGLIINTASLQYSQFSLERQDSLLRVVHTSLHSHRSDKIGTFVSRLRNPELVQDLVANWSAVNWPYLNDYQVFLKEATWKGVVTNLAYPENNPLMIALAIPYRWTPEELRTKFRETYPEISQKAIAIHASRLRCDGTHKEILGESSFLPERPAMTWEEAISYYLEDYGPEYHTELLKSIAEDKQPRTREWLTFDELAEKLGSTLFAFTEGRLARISLE